MELESQSSNANSPHVYVTAPTSPNGYSRSSSMELYYSAPASPRRNIGHHTFGYEPGMQKMNDDSTSNFDDFEFETSKKFSWQLKLESSRNFEAPLYDQDHEAKQAYHDRGDSLPAMAFADELFFNGLVMPLKLPPRLQYDSDINSFSQRSVAASPRSPRTTCKLPFSYRSSWNDDFDPFVVALRKVREEKRGSHHKRSRSYSPFRSFRTKCSSETEGNEEQKDMVKTVQASPPNYVLNESKGSAYARWVRHQNGAGLTPKGPKSPRGLFFGGQVRPLQTDREGPGKSISITVENGGHVGATKVQKLKGLLLRYASFGRENKQTKQNLDPWKSGYLSWLSFRFKANGKKKMSADSRMAVVEHKPMKQNFPFA